MGLPARSPPLCALYDRARAAGARGAGPPGLPAPLSRRCRAGPARRCRSTAWVAARGRPAAARGSRPRARARARARRRAARSIWVGAVGAGRVDDDQRQPDRGALDDAALLHAAAARRARPVDAAHGRARKVGPQAVGLGVAADLGAPRRSPAGAGGLGQHEHDAGAPPRVRREKRPRSSRRRSGDGPDQVGAGAIDRQLRRATVASALPLAVFAHVPRRAPGSPPSPRTSKRSVTGRPSTTSCLVDRPRDLTRPPHPIAGTEAARDDRSSAEREGEQRERTEHAAPNASSANATGARVPDHRAGTSRRASATIASCASAAAAATGSMRCASTGPASAWMSSGSDVVAALQRRAGTGGAEQLQAGARAGAGVGQGMGAGRLQHGDDVGEQRPRSRARPPPAPARRSARAACRRAECRRCGGSRSSAISCALLG